MKTEINAYHFKDHPNVGWYQITVDGKEMEDHYITREHAERAIAELKEGK